MQVHWGINGGAERGTTTRAQESARTVSRVDDGKLAGHIVEEKEKAPPQMQWGQKSRSSSKRFFDRVEAGSADLIAGEVQLSGQLALSHKQRREAFLMFEAAGESLG